MKPFDLQAALRGEPVCDSSGNIWKLAGHNPNAGSKYRLLFWDNEGIGRAVSEEGRCGLTDNLFMAQKERKEYVIRYKNIYGNYCFENRVFDTLRKAENFVINQSLCMATIHEITVIE